MFTTIPITRTLCGHEVSRMAEGRWNVDGSDDGYAEGLTELADLLTSCPSPFECATDVAWRLDERVAE